LELFKYRAVRVKQTPDSPWMVLFSAPATQIDTWAGVPQKRQLGERETTGFQREVSDSRLKGLRSFYADPANVIQNPLLCASKKAAEGSATFTPDPGESGLYSQTGTLTIQVEDLANWTLLRLVKAVKADIERRAPHLKGQPIPPSIILDIKSSLSEQSPEPDEDQNDQEQAVEDEDIQAADDQPAATELAFDESHILEFWQDVAARAQVLEELNDDTREEIQSFTKDAMIAFLLPLVIVDGQHRLRGALDTAKSQVSKEPYLSKIEKEVEDGGNPKEIQKKFETQASRVLPISLLLDTHPAEHVFQFVVVNQKATPIGRALLGTIVSTSLSDAELELVSTRLMAAGIPLEESRAAAFLARSPESPFAGLVERGISTESGDLLPWTVLVALVKIFRELKGGKLFHEKSNDYADVWRARHLANSGIVAGWSETDYDNEFQYWRSLDGPWRKVFTAFWTSVRDKLAKKSNPEAWHYWGSPRKSNIFNKPSLIILASDFFQFLCETKSTIDSAGEVPDLVDEWLTGVDSDYFNRDWKLQNTKKDSPGTRKTWSQTWVEYRKNPTRLPRQETYRKSAT
jgi:hypothetical protein